MAILDRGSAALRALVAAWLAELGPASEDVPRLREVRTARALAEGLELVLGLEGTGPETAAWRDDSVTLYAWGEHPPLLRGWADRLVVSPYADETPAAADAEHAAALRQLASLLERYLGGEWATPPEPPASFNPPAP